MRRSRVRSVTVGTVYGRWLVQEFADKNVRGELRWLCKCECGTVKTVKGKNLLNGESKSCGCLWREVVTSHGMTNTPTFKSWESMLQRCTNKNSPDWPRWGGKGIKVCERWFKFENFYADMGERPLGTSIDRINNKGNYEPGNCHWATKSEQQRNKSNSRSLTYKGETKALLDWAQETGIPYDLLLRRANRGVPENEIFAPSRSKKVSRFGGLDNS